MRLGRAALACLCLWLLPVAALGQPVKFTTIDRGQQSNIDEARQEVVRTAAEWTALWRVHGAPRPKLPVDFSKVTVVGVFLGARPTAGFDIEITAIEKQGADTVVTWRQENPPRGGVTSQVLTMPYHIVSIPRTTGKITFKTDAAK